MGRTNLGRKYGISRWSSSSKLFVSAEFEKSIKDHAFASQDNYMVSAKPKSDAEPKGDCKPKAVVCL